MTPMSAALRSASVLSPLSWPDPLPLDLLAGQLHPAGHLVHIELLLCLREPLAAHVASDSGPVQGLLQCRHGVGPVRMGAQQPELVHIEVSVLPETN